MAVCKICEIREKGLGSGQPVTCGKICIALFWGLLVYAPLGKYKSLRIFKVFKHINLHKKCSLL